MATLKSPLSAVVAAIAASGGGGGTDETTATLGGAVSGWAPVAVSWTANAANPPGNTLIQLDSSPAPIKVGCYTFQPAARDLINASHHGDNGRAGGFWLPAGLTTLRLRMIWGTTATSNGLEAYWRFRMYQSTSGTYTEAGMTKYETDALTTHTAAVNVGQETTIDITITGYTATRPVYVTLIRDGTDASDDLDLASVIWALSLECQ